MRVAWLLAMLISGVASAAQPDVSAAITSATVSVGGKLTINIVAAPLPAFNPTTASIPCNLAPGTVVSNVTVSGGSGGPVALSIADPGASFALSTTAPPANVIVAPSGVAPSLCPAPGAQPIIDTVTVTATL